MLCTKLGRQVYENEDEESNVDTIDLAYDNGKTQPIEINAHLNNPLIKIDLKVNIF